MAAEIVRFRFTIDECEQMIATGILTEDDRVELVDGEIIETSPIGDDHVFALNALTELLFDRLAGRAIISVQNPIRLSGQSRPQPDIALWRRGNRRTVPGPEDVLLLIEVAGSSLMFDRDVKLPLYAHAGIREVWIVNLIDEQVELYRDPTLGEYRSIEFIGPGEEISSLIFPDVVIAVDDVLA